MGLCTACGPGSARGRGHHRRPGHPRSPPARRRPELATAARGAEEARAPSCPVAHAGPSSPGTSGEPARRKTHGGHHRRTSDRDWWAAADRVARDTRAQRSASRTFAAGPSPVGVTLSLAGGRPARSLRLVQTPSWARTPSSRPAWLGQVARVPCRLTSTRSQANCWGRVIRPCHSAMCGRRARGCRRSRTGPADARASASSASSSRGVLQSPSSAYFSSGPA